MILLAYVIRKGCIGSFDFKEYIKIFIPFQVISLGFIPLFTTNIIKFIVFEIYILFISGIINNYIKAEKINGFKNMFIICQVLSTGFIFVFATNIQQFIIFEIYIFLISATANNYMNKTKINIE